MFLDHGWPQVTETAEGETADGRDSSKKEFDWPLFLVPRGEMLNPWSFSSKSVFIIPWMTS